MRVHGKRNLGTRPRAKAIDGILHATKSAAVVEKLRPQAAEFSCIRQARGDGRTHFVPVRALLVGMRDLQDPRFIQRFA